MTLPAALPAWAEAGPERRAHIERVAALAGQWAERMRVSPAERERWLRAVWLHDALRDAAPASLDRWAADSPVPGSLRHGPAAAARAASEGETDRGLLDAVRYHSIGCTEWDMAGRVLYCADYLEPGRVFGRERRAELAEHFADDPAGVLLAVAGERLAHIVRSGMPLIDPTVRFWNSLVAPSGSR
ncbi:MAG: HD domain-containing protein [Gemmatimonadales bacterium]